MKSNDAIFVHACRKLIAVPGMMTSTDEGTADHPTCPITFLMRRRTSNLSSVIAISMISRLPPGRLSQPPKVAHYSAMRTPSEICSMQSGSRRSAILVMFRNPCRMSHISAQSTRSHHLIPAAVDLHLKLKPVRRTCTNNEPVSNTHIYHPGGSGSSPLRSFAKPHTRCIQQ
jgi:hypothetical protein